MASFAAIRSKLELTESEETWDKIASAISDLKALVHTDDSDQDPELVPLLRSLARPFISAMNSERTRLSGVAVDTLGVIVCALGPQFEPLIPILFPPLLALCSRSNKITVARAQKSIYAIIENTQLPALLPYFLDSAQDKSMTLRLACAEGTLACLNSLNPLDLEKDTRIHQIEAIVRLSGRDASAQVRQTAKKMYKAYQELLPTRIDTFANTLSPTIKKTLGASHTTVSHQSTLAVPRPRSAAAISRKGETNLTSSTSSLQTQPRPQTSLAHTRSASSSDAQLPAVAKRPLKRTMPPPQDIPKKNPLPTRAVTRVVPASDDLRKRPISIHSIPSRPPSATASHPSSAAPSRPTSTHSDSKDHLGFASLSSSRTGPVRIPKPQSASNTEHDQVLNVARRVPLPDDDRQPHGTSSTGPRRAPISSKTTGVGTSSKAPQRKPPIPVLHGSKSAGEKLPEPSSQPRSTRTLTKPVEPMPARSRTVSRPNPKGKKPDAPTHPAPTSRQAPDTKSNVASHKQVPVASADRKKESSSRPLWGARPANKKSDGAGPPVRPQIRRPAGKDSSSIPRAVHEATKIPLPPSPKPQTTELPVIQAPTEDLGSHSPIHDSCEDDDGKDSAEPLCVVPGPSVSPDVPILTVADTSAEQTTKLAELQAPSEDPGRQSPIYDSNDDADGKTEAPSDVPSPTSVFLYGPSASSDVPILIVDEADSHTPSTPKAGRSGAIPSPQPTPISQLVASIEQGFIMATPAPTPAVRNALNLSQESSSGEQTPVSKDASRTPLQNLSLSEYLISPISSFPVPLNLLGKGLPTMKQSDESQNQPLPSSALHYMDPSDDRSEFSIALERFNAAGEDGW